MHTTVLCFLGRICIDMSAHEDGTLSKFSSPVASHSSALNSTHFVTTGYCRRIVDVIPLVSIDNPGIRIKQLTCNGEDLQARKMSSFPAEQSPMAHKA